MSFRTMVGIALLVLGTPVYANDGRAIASANAEVASAPRMAQAREMGSEPDRARLKTVVLGFRPGTSIKGPQVRMLNEALVFELAQDRKRSVIGPEDLRGMLELEAQKAIFGCDDSACIAEIGQALDADRMVQGTVERVGRGWFMLVTELDARTMTPIARVQRRVPTGDFERLLSQMRLLVLDLATAQTPGADEVGVLIVTSIPSAEILLNGRSFGLSPAVIDDARVGSVQLELLLGAGASAQVVTRVFAGEVTTVNAQLDIERGASADELASHDSQSFWTRVVGGMVIGGGCFTCLASPCLALPGLAGDLVGLGQVTTPSLNVHSGYCLAFFGVIGISLGICGAGGGVAAYGAGAAPESEGAHRIVITPPLGRGRSETIDLDPVTGAVLPPLASHQARPTRAPLLALPMAH